jgi:cell division protein FtsN
LRLRTFEAELGLASDAPDPAHPAAALYLVTEQHLVAGQSAAAQQSLAALVAAYPASPERFLAEARVALLSPASAEPLVPRPSVVRPYAAPSVLIGVAMADLSDDTRALATLPMVAGDALVSAATEPPAPLYAIQTGAYSDQENAEHVVGQLIQAGFPARAAAAAGSVAANVVRVLVGVHLVQDDADRLLADLRAAGYDGFLRAEA